VLNAKFFNVPQSRERVFIVGVRNDINKSFMFPEPSSTIVSLYEALRDVPPSDGAEYSPTFNDYFKEEITMGDYSSQSNEADAYKPNFPWNTHPPWFEPIGYQNNNILKNARSCNTGTRYLLKSTVSRKH
jgi:site-specific DNA-cytosine methylase